MLNPDCVFAIKISHKEEIVPTTSNCDGQAQLRKDQETQPKVSEMTLLSDWHLS